jgi:hypothetical protein
MTDTMNPLPLPEYWPFLLGNPEYVIIVMT